MHRHGVDRRTPVVVFFALMGVLGFLLVAGSAGAAGAGAISGTAFKDLNRNGVWDVDEAPIANDLIYLFDANGAYVAGAYTDPSGHYSFPGLADGGYTIQYASPSWWAVREDWVPTTTGSVFPKVSLQLSGSAVADFGWRPIVRSTDLNAPIATYVGQNGLLVKTYNDAVAPKDISDKIVLGTVGPEAAFTTVLLDAPGGGNDTAASVAFVDGRYTNYQATCYAAYDSWLDTGASVVSHEYGHAWSLYNAYVVQQDPDLTAYIAARGLTGDPRLGSSHTWSAREMLAEDYRQLLGFPSGQAATQENRDIPPATDVPGLREFLATTFTQPPPSAPPPPPSPTLSVSGTTVTPKPVVNSGTVSATISLDASVTITIKDSRGRPVRTLLAAASEPAGTVSAIWDRKNSSGRRVKAGTYSALVQATRSDGSSASSSATFKVS